MSNRAYLDRTMFRGDDGSTGWGWRMGDDYDRSFTDYHEETEVPEAPLELLAKVAAEATENESDLLETLLDFEKGMYINGSWHGAEEIAPTLRKGLQLEA